MSKKSTVSWALTPFLLHCPPKTCSSMSPAVITMSDSDKNFLFWGLIMQNFALWVKKNPTAGSCGRTVQIKLGRPQFGEGLNVE